MGKIGLFGGTFDPVHNGHIAIAMAARDRLQLDKTVLIPAGDPPHKAMKKVTDKWHRLHMAELAFLPLGSCDISDYEVKKDTPSYSVDMLRHFQNIYPDNELFFIIGADSFADLPTWWHYRELLQLCSIVVVSRPDTKKSELLERFSGDEEPPRVFYLDNVHMDVSSTQIRAMLYRGEDVSALVPGAVCKYIKEHGLYVKSIKH